MHGTAADTQFRRLSLVMKCASLVQVRGHARSLGEPPGEVRRGCTVHDVVVDGNGEVQHLPRL